MNLATYDIENLYGNIDHDTGLQAINYRFTDKDLENKRISKYFTLGAVKLFLENSVFFFNDSYYRLLKGTAMGDENGPGVCYISSGFS